MVYDVNPQSSAEFGHVETSIKEVSNSSEIIFTMLPNKKIVDEVYRGSGGIIPNARSGTLLIDCSTVEFDFAQELHKETQKKRLNMIDAPVSGGTINIDLNTKFNT